MLSEFEQGNLGQRHKLINKRVHDAVDQNESFKNIKSIQESTFIDRLFKIDFACKVRNVDFIVENLKDKNMLYVSRALKSTWLITDPKYAHIVSPQNLEDSLFPQMLTTAVNKMRHCIYINLKDEKSCEYFYEYYKEKRKMSVAKHFFPKCSEGTIFNDFNLFLEYLNPHYLKLLCEKCPRVLLKFFDTLKEDSKLFNMFNYNQQKYFDVSKIILKSQPDIYFEVIEKFCCSNIYYKRLSAKSTKYIIDNHKDKYVAKPELYAGVLLDLPTLAQCLSEDDVMDLVERLARAEYLKSWFTLTYKSAEPLLKRISKKEKPKFVKKIFEDKDFGSIIREAPYSLPKVPSKNVDKDLLSDEDHNICSRPELLYGMAQKCCMRAYKGCPRPGKTLLDQLFDKYRFTAFSKTFFELKKLLQSESSHHNRLMILNVLVSKTLKHTENVQVLLELVHTRHANEPITLRASFLRSLVRRAAVYHLPEKPWQIFQDMVLQVIFQAEEQVPCDEGIHGIIIHDILNDIDISPKVFDTFLTVFNPLIEYDLSVGEKEKICVNLKRMLIAKSKSDLDKNNINDVIRNIKNLLDLLNAHKVSIHTSPEVLDVIKRVAEVDIEKSKDLLIHLYKMKKFRKFFTKENFILIQNNDSYLNALRHDVSLLRDTDKFQELVSKGKLKLDGFLIKLKIYFNDLVPKFSTLLEEGLLRNPDERPKLSLIRGLCILKGPAVWTIVKDMYTGGKETKLLAERYAANVHMAWSVNNFQDPVSKGVGVTATRNALSACPAAAVHARLPDLLAGPPPFVRLAIFLAFDRLESDDILNVAAHVRRNSESNAKRALLTKFHEYVCSKGEDINLDLWKQMRALIVEFRPFYNKKSWKILSDLKMVPDVLKMDYCLTILSVELSPDFELGNDINLAGNLHCFSKKENVNETDIQLVIKPLLEIFQKDKNMDVHTYLVYKSFVKVLARFLLMCETEAIQMERFETIGLPFLKVIKSSWNDKCQRIRVMQSHFEDFIFYLKCNKAFLNDSFVDCLPLFEKVVEEMHTFLDVKKYFSLYARVHLTMLHYKTLKQIKKQQPSVLAEQKDKVGVAAAVGAVFGRYLAREHRQLTTDYFPTITYLYADDTHYFVNHSNNASGDISVKFKIAIAKSLALSEENSSLLFAALLLHKFRFAEDCKDSDFQQVYNLITHSKDLHVQCLLSTYRHLKHISFG